MYIIHSVRTGVEGDGLFGGKKPISRSRAYLVGRSQRNGSNRFLFWAWSRTSNIVLVDRAHIGRVSVRIKFMLLSFEFVLLFGIAGFSCTTDEPPDQEKE